MIFKYDGCGCKCPEPLIKVRLLLKKMKGDDKCYIIINDNASIKDIPKFLQKKGYRFTTTSLPNDTLQITIN